jgi:hypothetical protein
MVTMALASLHYVAIHYCVWSPTVWGACAIKGQNGSRIDAPLPFNLVAITISTVIAMPFLFMYFLPWNFVVFVPKMQTEEALFEFVPRFVNQGLVVYGSICGGKCSRTILIYCTLDLLHPLVELERRKHRLNVLCSLPIFFFMVSLKFNFVCLCLCSFYYLLCYSFIVFPM